MGERRLPERSIRPVATTFLVLALCAGSRPGHAAIRPYGGVGTTAFSGSGVPGTSTGFGAGFGVDFASYVLALGLRGDAGYLGAGVNQWVYVSMVNLRLYFTPDRYRWRPYVEAGVGGGGARDLSGSPGYAMGGGGGILYESPGGPALFLDVRNVSLGNAESSGPTMLMLRVGLMK